VAFHVEISSGFRHQARAFNLDEERLRRTILDPWVRGRVIELGDREWEPKDCKLKILEGPELADSDIAMGRGWSNAERASENVTRRLVEQAATPPALAVAVIAETAHGEAELTGMLTRLGVDTLPWSELRARILSGAGIDAAAVLAVESAEPPASWMFDAGLARGALGSRAVIAQLSEGGIPAQLTGVEIMRLDPGDEASAAALLGRLTR
jgi:hypothetical protein